MKNEMLSTRIDHGTKRAFIDICDEVGLSPSQAIKIFAKAVINHGGIPFEIKTNKPTALTVSAIQELEQGNGLKVDSVEQLFKELAEANLDG